MNYEFHVLTGDVIDTTQRSDTHVSGSGSVSGYSGNVSGSTSISSIVVITRDVFVKADNGSEHALKFRGDMAFQVGNKISVFGVRSKGLVAKFSRTDRLAFFRVYNHATRQEFTQNDQGLLKGEDDPTMFLWGLLLTLFGGIGLPLVGWAIWRAIKAKGRRKRLVEEYRQLLEPIKAAA